MAAGVTANKTMMKKCTNFAGHFDGCGGCAGMIRRASPNGGDPGPYWRPLVAAIGQVLQPIVAIGHTNAVFLCFFIIN
jgi:hypothetical protein